MHIHQACHIGYIFKSVSLESFFSRRVKHQILIWHGPTGWWCFWLQKHLPNWQTILWTRSVGLTPAVTCLPNMFWKLNRDNVLQNVNYVSMRNWWTQCHWESWWIAFLGNTSLWSKIIPMRCAVLLLTPTQLLRNDICGLRHCSKHMNHVILEVIPHKLVW